MSCENIYFYFFLSILLPPISVSCLIAQIRMFSTMVNEWKSVSRVQLFATHGLYSPWNSLGQNTGVGSLSLLQGIFPTHGLNPDLSHCRQILYQLSHKGSSFTTMVNSSGESGHPCLIIFSRWGKLSVFQHWVWYVL